MDKFTKDDLLNCWDYALDYFVDVLNSEYSLESAREDLRSLIGSKWDGRQNEREEEPEIE